MADEKALRAGRRTQPRRSVGRRVLCTALHEKGQALVEFAIVVPLLMLLVLGIVDFGLAYNYKNDQTSLANQALRYAVVPPPCTPCGGQSIEDYVRTTADSHQLEFGNSGDFGIQQQPDGFGVHITFCLPNGSTGQEGQPLEAKATSTYNWLPFLHLGSVVIESSAIGRIEPGASYAPGVSQYATTYPLDKC
jgi:hypothetical protein